MPDNDEILRERNRALVSIYYHGRRETPELRGRKLPFDTFPLDEAVEVLTRDPDDDNALPSVRLALADLCRNRKALASDPQALAGGVSVANLIRKLATSYAHFAGIQNPDTMANDMVAIGELEENEAYNKVLYLLQARRGALLKLPEITDYRADRHG